MKPTGILGVLNSSWAIVPDKLFEITEIYGTHLRGEKIDFAGIEAALGKPMQHEPRGYTVTPDGVALLPVEGVLSKRMNMFSRMSGGTSMQLLARDFRDALADQQVNSVVLLIDSPGGTVDGTQEIARAVLDARTGGKPVVAWVDGQMASAAYWIGSAADAIYIGAGTDLVGSIGVAMQHVDYSGADAKSGIKRTDIYSGQYKRIASDAGPLSEEGRAYLQAQSDYYYSLFVDTVAAHRGASVEQVLTDMADGRIFIGQQAIDAGLVDGASTLDALVAALASGSYQRKRARSSSAAGAAADEPRALLSDATPASPPTGAGAAPIAEQPINEDLMDIKTLKEKHLDVAQALIDEGFAAGQAAGAETERQRILAVEAQAMPGHEALIATLKADGKTTGPEAAVQVLAAEKAKKGIVLANLLSDAPPPAPSASSPSGEPPASPSADAEDGLSVEERAEKQFKASAPIRAEFGTVERYTGWLKHEATRKAA